MKYKFIIKGSHGDLYQIKFNIIGAKITSSCSCIAGLNGSFCKHRYQILNGDTSNLKSNNYEELEKFYNELYFVKDGLEPYYSYRGIKFQKDLIKREKDKLEYFVSPEGFNIKGLGEINLKKLIESGVVVTPLDLFKLDEKKETILKSKKISESILEKILKAIEQSKNIEYSNFIYSLGIPYVGEYLSKILSNNTTNIKEYFNYSLEDFISISGIGEENAQALYSYFKNKNNKQYVEKLLELGINIVYEKKKRENQTLKGKKVAFTGKLKTLERREIKKVTEELGGEAVNTVNEGVDILVVGENAGSKLERAKKISEIEILTEDEFMNKYC